VTHIALTYFSMVIAPVAAIAVFYWLVGRASAIIESHQERRATINRRLNNTGRK
jgi:hypothetical protein